MTSYMYNPSKKVTEILSKFLEFDPAQLELGIWSGDLSLKNVNLRQESIDSLLNKKASQLHTDPRTKAPLRMKLVSGSIGSMRIQIPWKRMVWGQGSVQLEVSDVMIVLAFQSREETDAFLAEVAGQTGRSSNDAAGVSDKPKSKRMKRREAQKEEQDIKNTPAFRKAKQRRLREAERRHLQGLPVASWLDAVHRKNSIEKDAIKLKEEETKKQNAAAGGTATSSPASKPDGNTKHAAGRAERWVKNATSDFFWRFYAGLQASIKKARIVIIQDGIEVGCIVHSIEIIAGKEEIRVSVVMEDHEVESHANKTDNDASTSADNETLPSNVVYEGAYDDGEHVDKVVKQHGLGLFVRREGNMAKVPPTLRFSTSVSADDYVLRPVDLNLKFSMFYPYPPERRKKRATGTTQSHNSHPTQSTAASTNMSSDEITITKKKRRGKRDKASPVTATGASGASTVLTQSSATSGTMPLGSMPAPAIPPQRRLSQTYSGGREHSQRLRRSHRRAATALDGTHRSMATTGVGHMSRRTSTRSIMTRRGMSSTSFDDMSTGITEAPTVIPEHPAEPVPRLECHVDLDDIRVVFSTRHYELLGHFLATVERMKNGRPIQTIRSIRGTDAPEFQTSITLDRPYSGSLAVEEHVEEGGSKKNDKTSSRLAAMGTSLLTTPMKLFRPPEAGKADEPKRFEYHDDMELQLKLAELKHRSQKAEVTRKWWKYAIGAVKWELKKSESLKNNFRMMYISFDWSKQKHKRKEYIDLYVATKLEKRPEEEISEEVRNSQGEKMMKIEDELPLEQIVLYRSIARSLRSRRMSKMPDSILELHTANAATVASRVGFLSSAVEKLKNQSKLKKSARLHEEGPSALMSMIQERFEFARNLRGDRKIRRMSTAINHAADAPDDGSASRIESSGGPRDEGNGRRKSRKSAHDDDSQFLSRSNAHQSTSGGHDSMVSDTFNNSGQGQRKMSLGFEGSTQFDSITAASRAKEVLPHEPRNMKSMHSRTLRTRQTYTPAPVPSDNQVDTSMRFAFSFKIKSIDLMVVQEDYYFDFFDEVKGRDKSSAPFATSNDGLSRGYYSGDDSSSDGVSDLSGLTDDQRFFNEHSGPVTVPEEEMEEEGAKLSSTDFLHFGQPENPLLRLTIEPLVGSFRARSRGPKKVTISVGRISAIGDNGVQLLAVGYEEPPTPVAEVNLDGSYHRSTTYLDSGLDSSIHGIARSVDRSLDISRHTQSTDSEFRISGVSRKKSNRAVSMRMVSVDDQQSLLCDLSKIAVRVDLGPIAKLLQFYSKSAVVFPDKITSKSSREMARKYLVHKAVGSDINRVNASIKVNGIDVKVPLSANVTASEDSSLDSSPDRDGSRQGYKDEENEKLETHALFSLKCLELSSGQVVDDMCPTNNEYDDINLGSDTWKPSTRNWNYTGTKTLNMIDLAGLTSDHDPFSCHHWVVTVSSIGCVLDGNADEPPQLIESAVDIEALITFNHVALLHTENPKQQVTVGISPIYLLVSRRRLELLSQIVAACNFGALNETKLIKESRKVKPDPPRIEILSRQLLHSIDVSCKRFKVSFIKDYDMSESLSVKVKEIIMEECISDFLSIVSCFDFSLPNEEALSSAMQICIGRLVGIGFTDDEAWGCTNTARLNFLNDIALMKQTQSDAMVQLKSSIKESNLAGQTVYEEDSESSDDASIDIVEDSLNDDRQHNEFDENRPGREAESSSHCENDDDSENTANSIDIVETTLHNAVEKTVATFGSLLEPESVYFKRHNAYLIVDLETGLQISSVKLFYDSHITSTIQSLAITNAAGVELVTLIPSASQSVKSDEELMEASHAQHGVVFSRFDFDQSHPFGQGGLPISVLASDEGADGDSMFRARTRLDDLNIGEIEVLFASNISEELIEEMSSLKWNPDSHLDAKDGGNAGDSFDDDSDANATFLSNVSNIKRPETHSSSVMFASCISVLLTSDELVPFTRLTLDDVSYRNKQIQKVGKLKEESSPSWTVAATSFAVQNLAPEGQTFANAVEVLSSNTIMTEDPFQLFFYKSTDPWKESNRMKLVFRGYRVILYRQYLYELIHFMVSDQYGIGRLKEKYSKDIRDKNGNGKPPLLYSVDIHDTSLICPRMSTSSEMVAFEIQKASIVVSYLPESFAMPTESIPFDPTPSYTGSDSMGDAIKLDDMLDASGDISVSEFFDCVDGSSFDPSSIDNEPISSFDSSWMKRLTFNLERFRAYTVIPPQNAKKIIETPRFRYLYEINGRAKDKSPVYRRRNAADRMTSVSPQSLKDAERCIPMWQEMSRNDLNLEVFYDSLAFTRLLIADQKGLTPFALDARLSQFCLLLSVWFSNMQELPVMFPFTPAQVEESAAPPEMPKNFPKYGSADFVKMLQDLTLVKTEICCMFKMLSLRCTFDPPGYFSVDPECFQYFTKQSLDEDGFVLSLSDAVIHVYNDQLNIKRIGLGALGLELIDERRLEIFNETLTVRSDTASLTHDDNMSPRRAWANWKFGLHEGIGTLQRPLSVPFMMSVFMVPDWSSINVGASSADGIMFELSWIWIFLDFFKSYFTIAAFGNPGHEAEQWAHKVKNSLRTAMGQKPKPFVPLPGVNIDFRLWLFQPILCLPSDTEDATAPCLKISCKTGLWYRLKSINSLSSQEVASTDMNLDFLNEFRNPRACRRYNVHDGVSWSRSIIKGLSFGFRYECNNAHHHKDVSVQIPFIGEKASNCSFMDKEIDAHPIILSSPSICRPADRTSRILGPKVCDITCIIEVLPLTTRTMSNFFTGPELETDMAEPEDEPTTSSVSVDVQDIRVFAIDPELGVQLPVAVMSIGSLNLTMSKLALEDTHMIVVRGESDPEDFQVVANATFWADYFKLGITRSWEPLLETVKCTILYEKSKARGEGFTVNTHTPFHVNLSSALLHILSDTFESFQSQIRETFRREDDRSTERSRSMASLSPVRNRVGAMVEDSINVAGTTEVVILHEIPKPLRSGDRVAFSMRNLTGQKIRVHQLPDASKEAIFSQSAVITYLNQKESMGLTFAATVSKINNLSVTEVPYPGFSNSSDGDSRSGSLQHFVSIQVPGFKWLPEIKVDMFGRKFESLMPRSDALLAKIQQDWRLANALKVLTEVGLHSGGRLITVRSLFEIRNSSMHDIQLILHPDPKHVPMRPEAGGSKFPEHDSILERLGEMKTSAENDSDQILTIHPGETLQVPILLLESALHLSGNHLGSFWICPTLRKKDTRMEKIRHVDFSSRPIQLAKVVHESSMLFQSAAGRDIPVEKARTGIQVSCPTKYEASDTKAPFCYAIEVARSPVVRNTHGGERSSSDDLKEALVSKEKKAAQSAEKKMAETSKMKQPERLHGPIAYSLSIHPPLVITNLLPEGGRFELMHAVRRTVLWYADLVPGQQVPIHSVGLDAPLLLLVNLGFCRTPVGEGALVHHGADIPANARDSANRINKTIGKVVSKGRKRIGKKLNAISDTPDKRGKAKANGNNHTQSGRSQQVSTEGNMTGGQTQVGSLGLDNEIGMGITDGKIHSIDGIIYSENDLSTEATVVDGIGQRLRLNIENVRGGGGHRRISLFCPYWIVNTTEHALRYKQDKGKAYVSGTVSSQSKDGSRPVDGSNRNYRSYHSKLQARRASQSEGWQEAKTPLNKGTIFSGTPGALATSVGRCNLSSIELSDMLEANLELNTMSDLAFMFNFHEDTTSIGHHHLCVQLSDGTEQTSYASDWSRRLSLESVGVSQVVSMHCKDGRALEISAIVSVAPGFLSGYTKIVRFLPRYVFFNMLDRPLRIWQHSSVFHQGGEEQFTGENGEMSRSYHGRKWRLESEVTISEDNGISQYESLYGRPVTIGDTNELLSIPRGTTAHDSALYIASVAPLELVTFHLPDSRTERQLRLDFGGAFNISSSFATDAQSEHTLRLSSSVDSRALKFVSTRAAPKYKIILPPPELADAKDWDGELGVFFETDWGGDRRIVVKGTKRGRYAFNHTDIHVGDELLRIDGMSVARMTFAETMKLLKERLTSINTARNDVTQEPENALRRGMRRLSLNARRTFGPGTQKQPDDQSAQPTQLSLTFRTLEERLRKARMRANATNMNTEIQKKQALQRAGSQNSMRSNASMTGPNEAIADIHVETKSVSNINFIILRPQDPASPPFRIQNRSLKQTVFYRQRGCEGHPWNYLSPGESSPYSWEEPMKSKKLILRVASNSFDVFKADFVSHDAFSDLELDVSSNRSEDARGLIEESKLEKRKARVARMRQALAYQYVNNEERGGFGPAVTVRLEEIGHHSLLPLAAQDSTKNYRLKFLNCEVDTDGGTRLLIISNEQASLDERGTLQRHLNTLRKQSSYEEQRISDLNTVKATLTRRDPQHDKYGYGPTNAAGDEKIANQRRQAAESEAILLMDDYSDEAIVWKRHQMIVEVMEVVGLSASDIVGAANLYCEVTFKARSKVHRYFFQKQHGKHKTYFVENSVKPKWNDQTFLFDVPEEAVKVTRGYSVHVKVRNFRAVGQHPVLGQAVVHLGNVRNQKELTGWYPLGGRTGRRDVEASPLSDFGRGSIKLRVHWVHTTSALLDYFRLLCEKRLLQLAASQAGMREQLANAIESDRRKREATDQLSRPRLGRGPRTKPRQQRKPPAKKVVSSRPRTRSDLEGKARNVVGKLNSSVSVLKDTLKSSRDRYLYALYFQTVESKRKRLDSQEMPDDDGTEESDNHQAQHTDSDDPDEQINPPTRPSKKSLDGFFSSKRASSFLAPEQFESSKRSLDDFFSQQKQGPDSALLDRLQLDTKSLTSGVRQRRSAGPGIEGDGLRRAVSHRRLSLDKDDTMLDDESVKNWRPFLRHGQSMYDAMGHAGDMGMSDLISVNTDIEEEQKKKKVVHGLLREGFTFHETGAFFHDNHLPRHFRRSLFSPSELREITYLNRPRWIVGTTSTIRHFKSWQSASAIYNDAEIELSRSENCFTLRLKAYRPVKVEPSLNADNIRALIESKFAVPSISPELMLSRAEAKIESMYQSRTTFEKASRRSLKAMMNPGGWLTIRPITVLNLPDAYTNMFVRLRYGSSVLNSESVDAAITPRWISQDAQKTMECWDPQDQGTLKGDGQRQSTSKFEFNVNDLHIQVEPQQTSGVIKLSIIAERSQNKAELGTLNIPLGKAIEACIDSAENYLDSDSDSTNARPRPMYVRWFPLKSPRDSAPAAGDMGFSDHPSEQEQVRDNAFAQYFAPCIQLALIWWPDTEQTESTRDEDSSGAKTGTTTIVGPSGSMNFCGTPMVQKYYNANISRISAALIDSQKASELLAFVASNIDLRYSVKKNKTRIGIVVGWIQIDHQDRRSREPVVLAPTPVEHVQPTLQFLAIRDNLRTKSNIVSYEYIGVALQEMDFTVEESAIFDIWEFFMAILKRRKSKQSNLRGQRRADVLRRNENCFYVADVDVSDVTPTLFSLLRGDDGVQSATERKVYIEQLVLGLVKVNLSYFKGKKQSFELSDEGARALRNAEVKDLSHLALSVGKKHLAPVSRSTKSAVFVRWSQHTSDEELFQDDGGTISYNLPGIIAAVFPSVSDAPIRLQGKTINHIFDSPMDIFTTIQNFYVNETLKQVYKIIGSLDFVGNPTILFSSFVTGVRDLVVAPVTAFLKSPTDVNQLGIGVAKGAISLFSHSASGIFGFTAKMSATAGHAAAILSLDAEYRQWHRDRIVNEVTNLNREWKRRGVQDISEIITRPVGDIVLGVAMGASGFFIAPYKGFRKKGKWGLVKGVAKGTAGVVAKPIVGCLDAFTHFSATVHDIAKSVNVLERRYQPALKLRLPYIFGPMKILAPFDPVAARSMYLLSVFKPKFLKRGRQKYLEADPGKEIHIMSEILLMEPGVETYAIVTTLRVVLAKLKKDNAGALHPSFCWEVSFHGRHSVASQVSDHGHNGVALTITKTKRAAAEQQRGYLDQKVEGGLEDIPDSASHIHFEMSQAEDFQFEDRDGRVGPADDAVSGYEVDQGDVTGLRGMSQHGESISEWFTILAEYQHRQQLTKIHNAISCILGNHDAVIAEHRAAQGATEGVTSFGMFNFEKVMLDRTEHDLDHTRFVASLDVLPWLGEELFRELQRVPPSQQRDATHDCRRNWTFLSQINSSKVQGGPEWLITSRARATYIPVEFQDLATGSSDDSDQSWDIMDTFSAVEPRKGDDTSLARSELDIYIDETYSDEDFNVDHGASTKSAGSIRAHALHGPQTGSSKPITPEPSTHSQGYLPRPMVVEETLINEDDGDAQGARPLSRTETDTIPSVSLSSSKSTKDQGERSIDESPHEDVLEPVKFDDDEDNRFRVNTSQTSRSNSNPRSIQSTPEKVGMSRRSSLKATSMDHLDRTAVPNVSFDSEATSSSAHHGNRLHRLENLIEQLVIFNATNELGRLQMSQEEVTGSNLPTSPLMANASLRVDVAELRAQVQARSEEDEKLKQEVSSLRAQLAERRQQPLRSQGESDPNSRNNMLLRKVPNILRFVGKSDARKGESANGNEAGTVFKDAPAPSPRVPPLSVLDNDVSPNQTPQGKNRDLTTDAASSLSASGKGTPVPSKRSMLTRRLSGLSSGTFSVSAHAHTAKRDNKTTEKSGVEASSRHDAARRRRSAVK